MLPPAAAPVMPLVWPFRYPLLCPPVGGAWCDPPRTGLEPGKALDRLPPGQGSYAFREFFALMAAKGYPGFASYEAPNEAAWKRDPADVAREALAATRAVLPEDGR